MRKILRRLFFIFIVCAVGYVFLTSIDSNTGDIEEVVLKDEELLEIYYFDVGEADSTLIRYKNHNILIDAGNTIDGKKLSKYLKSIGVTNIELAFATHAHEDHIGGMQWIVYKIPVDVIYMPEHFAEWKSYQNLMNSTKEKNVPIKVPQIDQEFNIEDLNIKVLWVGKSEDYNENSIVLKLNYKNTNYLFMGDATNDVELQILDKDIKSDVLKVGHHGSKNSSSANFLYKVEPKYAIISVGKDNEYGHPHDIVLEKLEKLNTTIYRTDLSHTIRLKSDGEGIKFDFIKTDVNGGDLRD
ncbi:MAG: MBL fold metallo-hydrolase [Bacilli bacterium]|nr:MBL fold metallo-hydrolase [Bacilli bacterium]